MSDGFSADVVRAAYAAVAGQYMTSYGDDLAHLVLDRRVLDLVAEQSRERGPVVDVGSGPAQLAEYLLGERVDTVAVDFTTAMLDIARKRLPRLQAVAADVRALPVRSGSAAAIVAFYVLQHVPRHEIATVLGEFRRCVLTDGLLALGVHEGDGEFHVGDVTATLFTADELAQALQTARFDVEHVDHRDPLPHERQGPRAYLVARAY